MRVALVAATRHAVQEFGPVGNFVAAVAVGAGAGELDAILRCKRLLSALPGRTNGPAKSAENAVAQRHHVDASSGLVARRVFPIVTRAARRAHRLEDVLGAGARVPRACFWRVATAVCQNLWFSIRITSIMKSAF